MLERTLDRLTLLAQQRQKARVQRHLNLPRQILKAATKA